MANRLVEAAKKDLHPQAQTLFRKYVNEFGESLLLQAKLLAYIRKDEIVLSNHVDEAYEIISKERQRKRWTEFVIILGGAFFGAFVPGFLTELANNNTGMVVTYTLLGFLGLLLIFWGLQQ